MYQLVDYIVESSQILAQAVTVVYYEFLEINSSNLIIKKLVEITSYNKSNYFSYNV
jgi:hypothetical protein